MYLVRVIFWLTLFCLLSTSAIAETTSLVAISDNTLIEDFAGSRSNGSADAIYVGKTQRDGLRRGLIRFDVSAIPANANIQSATLSLHVLRGRPEEIHLSVHRSLDSWGEGTSNYFGGVGGPAQTNDATWLHRFYGTNQLWSNVGGDFISQASATEVIEAPENITHTITGAGLATDVAHWLAQTNANYGWMLIADADSSAKGFASRENSNSMLRPQLIVNWTPAVSSNNDSTDAPLPIWLSAGLASLMLACVRRYS
jgi:hypothetical protein